MADRRHGDARRKVGCRDRVFSRLPDVAWPRRGCDRFGGLGFFLDLDAAHQARQGFVHATRPTVGRLASPNTTG